MGPKTTDRTYRMRVPRWVWIGFAMSPAICAGLSVAMLLRLAEMDRRMPQSLTSEQQWDTSPLRNLWWTALMPWPIALPPACMMLVLWRRQRNEYVQVTDEGIVRHRASGKEQLTPWADISKVRAQLFGFSKNPAVMVYSGRRRVAVAGHDYPERASFLAEVTARSGLTEVEQSSAQATYTRPTQEQPHD